MKHLLISGKNQKGQGLVEYALILAIVSIVAIGILVLLATSDGNIFGTINSSLSGL